MPWCTQVQHGDHIRVVVVRVGPSVTTNAMSAATRRATQVLATASQIVVMLISASATTAGVRGVGNCIPQVERGDHGRVLVGAWGVEYGHRERSRVCVVSPIK